MSAGVQTKVQVGPAQSFTPAGTGLLQRKSTLCNTAGLVGERSERDEKGLTPQRSPVDQAEPSAVPPIMHEVLRSPGQPLDLETRAFMEPRFGHDFSRISMHSTRLGMIQTKLKINKPGDPYEQEADKMADAVMRMPEVQMQPEGELVQTKPVITPLIQSQSEREEEGEEEFLQTGELPGQSAEVMPALSSSIQNLRGDGQALAESTRAFFEPRFRQDLNHVRIHYNDEAVHYSDHLCAKAFTLGNHIYFGKNQYQPETNSGKKLIAHELTHVDQQAQNNVSAGIQRTLDQQQQRERLLDLSNARILQVLYGRLYSNPFIVIQHAVALQQNFTNITNRPITRNTLARILIRMYRVLLERAESAERDPNGVLQWPGFRGQEPWAPNSPTRVEEIAPFSEANIAAWQRVLEQDRLRQVGNYLSRIPPARSQARPQQVAPRNQPPVEDQENEEQEIDEQDQEPETQDETLSVPISTGLREQPQASSEVISGEHNAGGSEIRNGISQLRGTRLRTLNQAVVSFFPENFAGDVQTAAEIPANTSLLSVTRLIFYISEQRCYVVDRNGFISGNPFHFDLEWTRDLQAGTYFLANYTAGPSSIRILSSITGPNDVSVAWTHLRIRGDENAPTGASRLDIQVQNDRVFNNIISSVLSRNGGIGIVISQQARRSLDLPTSLLGVNLSLIDQAWQNALTENLLYWALRRKINEIENNLWDTLVETVRDAIIEAIVRRIRGSGYMMLFQGLQLAAWLGRVSSIAGFGTRDEMHLASQYIARSIVDFMIDEFILEGSISLVGRGAARALNWNLNENYMRMEDAVDANRPILGDDAPMSTSHMGGPRRDLQGLASLRGETIPEPNQEASGQVNTTPEPDAFRPSIRPIQPARANRDTQDTVSPVPSPRFRGNSEARVEAEEQLRTQRPSVPRIAAVRRSFQHRPNIDPRMDPLDPDRVQLDTPSGGRGGGNNDPGGPNGPGGPNAQPSLPLLPATLTPEMLERPHIGVPPEMLLGESPSVRQVTQNEVVQENDQVEQPSEFAEPELSQTTRDMLRDIFYVAVFLDESGLPLRGHVRSRQRIIEHYSRLGALRDSISEELPRMEINIIRDALSLADRRLQFEQEIYDRSLTRQQELEHIEQEYRRNNPDAPEGDYTRTNEYLQVNTRLTRAAFRIADALEIIDQQIDNLVDRPMLTWLNRARHNRRFRVGARAVMEASVSYAVDVIDTDADTNDWSSTTRFDPESESDRLANQIQSPSTNTGLDSGPIRTDHITLGDATQVWTPITASTGQQALLDEHGNQWTYIEDSNTWEVALTTEGSRHLRLTLGINLAHYLRWHLRPPRPFNTLSDRIRTYVIVDAQGRLVPKETPPLPRNSRYVETLAMQVTDRYGRFPERENIEWIFISPLDLWILHDRNAPVGEVLEYVTRDGETVVFDRVHEYVNSEGERMLFNREGRVD